MNQDEEFHRLTRMSDEELRRWSINENLHALACLAILIVLTVLWGWSIHRDYRVIVDREREKVQRGQDGQADPRVP